MFQIAAKIAANLLADKKSRQAIFRTVIGIFLLIAMIISMAAAFLSGLGGLVFGNESDVKGEWEYVKNRITDAFSEVNRNVSADIRKEISEFMPDFTVRLAKLAIEKQKSYNFPVFTSAELKTARETLEKIGDEIRGRLPEIPENDDGSRVFIDPVYKINQRPFLRDNAFLSGANFDSYRSQVKNLITDKKNDDFEADLAVINEVLGDARGAEFEQKVKYLSNKSWDDNAGSGGAKMFGELRGNAFADLLRSNFKAGFFQNEITKTPGKITITISAPTEERLYRAFGLTLQDKSQVVEFQAVTENRLNAAGISGSRTISADRLLDLNLFSRFGGIFAFPAEKSDVQNLGAVFGQIDKLHKSQPLLGLVINFKNPAEIYAETTANCITNAKIESQTAASVTMQYEIDTEKFRQEFGFPLAEIVGSPVYGTAVLNVRYGCLGVVTAENSDSAIDFHIGKSLPEQDDDDKISAIHNGAYYSHLTLSVWLNNQQIEPRLLFGNYTPLAFEPPTFHAYGKSAIFRYPLDKKWNLLTTLFGYDPWRRGNHLGVDIGDAGIQGADVFAAADGTVTEVCFSAVRNGNPNDGSGWGNFVTIDRGGGLQTRYAHLEPHYVHEIPQPLVQIGDKISAGQKIGTVGCTGFSAGYHLHFEVISDGVRANPLNFYDTFP